MLDVIYNSSLSLVAANSQTVVCQTFEERTKLHPERSFTCKVASTRVLAEAEKLRDAVNRGGYREGYGFCECFTYALLPAAIQALIDNLNMLVLAADIEDFEVDYDETWEATEDAPRLTVTILFEREEDAIRFRSSLIADALML